MTDYQFEVVSSFGPEVLSGDTVLLRMLAAWHEPDLFSILMFELQEKFEQQVAAIGEALLPAFQKFADAFAELRLT